MKYRRIGKTGLKVSEISIGGWLTYGRTVEDNHTAKIIQKAVESGINFIDMADIYATGESELAIGKAIKPFTRSDLVLSSKLFWPMSKNVNDRGLNRKHIMESVEKSLKRIGTDYLDLYFCHRYDKESETEETVRAMDDLIRQGKILYWGTSVWDSKQINKAVNIAKQFGAYQPVVEQPRYNMIDRHIETEIMPTTTRHGIGLVVWSPLAQGILTGKYNDGIPKNSRGSNEVFIQEDLTEKNIAKVRKLTKIADDAGVKLSHLAMAWCLRKKEISSIITGASSLKQLQENLKVSEFKLTEDLLKKVERIIG